MGRLPRLLILTAIVSGCADDSVTGTDDGTLPDQYLDGFVIGLGTQTVGNPTSPSGVDIVPMLYMSAAAGTTDPDWQVNYAPSGIRSGSGGAAPVSALTAGRRVRVWTSSPALLIGAPFISADSIIVMD